ncbi:MAG: 5-oxoprolinase subunit PxpB [Streptosporangiaceae bacterium]
MRVRSAGDAALLVETGDLSTTHRFRAALERAALPGVTDIVPGACTVLVAADPDRADMDRLAQRLRDLPLAATEESAPPPLEVPVVYDGEDLDEVAGLVGRSVDEIVARHTGSEHVVAFLGFSPGFGYLSGLDPSLHVPRRPSPRTRVPAGSVGVAGPYSCVYPSATPGGWRLIGRTDLRVWHPGREPPALFQPGRPVRFVAAA